MRKQTNWEERFQGKMKIFYEYIKLPQDICSKAAKHKDCTKVKLARGKSKMIKYFSLVKSKASM